LPLGCAGNSRASPLETAGPFAYMARTATAFTERQYGHGFCGNGYGERQRNAENQVSD